MHRIRLLTLQYRTSQVLESQEFFSFHPFLRISLSGAIDELSGQLLPQQGEIG